MRKGFTLIELLAVIVILAIVSLIAVPTITNVVEKARKEATLQSINGHIDAIEKQIIADEVKSSSKIGDDGTYRISDLQFSIKGERAKDGVVTINKGRVKEARFCIGKYSVDYDGKTPKFSDNDYCSENTVTLKSNGTKLNTKGNGFTYTVDLSGKTNINCSNGATPSVEGNKLTVNNVLGSTTCDIGSSLKYTFSHLNNGNNNIIMVSDETTEEQLSVAQDKTINLDLGNHKINYTKSENFFLLVSGNLTITGDNSQITSVNKMIKVENTGKLHITGGSYISLDEAPPTGSSIMVQVYGDLTIDDGRFEAKACSLISAYNSGKLNINGGVFLGYGASIIAGNQTSTINITNKHNRVYVANFYNGSNEWFNKTIWILNANISIKGEKADQCNENVGSNKKGICIYSTRRTILNEVKSTSNINISGASIVSKGKFALSTYDGIINVINSNILSDDKAIGLVINTNSYDQLKSRINICNSHLYGKVEDIYVAENAGYVKYNSSVNFNNKINDLNSSSHVSLDNTIKCK